MRFEMVNTPMSILWRKLRRFKQYVMIAPSDLWGYTCLSLTYMRLLNYERYY